MQECQLFSRPPENLFDSSISSAQKGVLSLGLGEERDGLLYVPPSYSADTASPLIVLLHGDCADAKEGLGLMDHLPTVDESAAILLAPDSRRLRTWDAIEQDHGPDVRFIDRALEHVFKRYNINPDQIAIGGYSDGASYALSLGINNWLLFSHILAFSPCFTAPPRTLDCPHIFISHGTKDLVLNVDRCSRRTVRRIKNLGYPLVYREYPGGHTVPTYVAQEALEFFLGKRVYQLERTSSL